jgi:hypothetical protein
MGWALHYAAPDNTVVETSLPAAERADSSEDVQGRIARYLSSGERQTDQANHDHLDVARTSVERIAPPDDVDSAENSAPCHLAFISSPRGYALVELDGPPPALGEDIELPEQPGSFQVAKLGASPLPNDPRICAYLSPAAENRWTPRRLGESDA